MRTARRRVLYSVPARAEDLLPDIYSLAKDSRTDAVPRQRIFGSLARYALLDPATTKKGGADDEHHVSKASPVRDLRVVQ